MTQNKSNVLKSVFIYFLLIVGVLLLAACGGSDAAAAIDPYEIGDPENGRVLFENGNDVIKTKCTRCHTLDGTETVYINGEWKSPSMQGIGARAGDVIPEMSAEEYIRQSIIDPDAYIAEGYGDHMSAGFQFGFSEEEINDLVAFLLTQ